MGRFVCCGDAFDGRPSGLSACTRHQVHFLAFLEYLEKFVQLLDHAKNEVEVNSFRQVKAAV